MPRSQLSLAVAFVVGVLALGGCSSGKKDATPEATWTLRYDAATSVRLAALARNVILDGDAAIFSFTDRSSDPLDRVGSVDLTSGTRTVLARTGFPGGSIIAAVRVGAEVVYIDESARGNLTPGTAKWRLIALSSHRVLASSGGRRVTMSPDLVAIDGAAVWTVYPRQGGGEPRAFEWKPGGEVQRRDALPGDELECTPPATSAELVSGCDQQGGWIAWLERTDPAGPVDDVNPEHLFFAVADSGSPHRIGDVLYDVSPPVIFGDYLLWDSGKGLEVTSLDHPTATVEVQPVNADATQRLVGSSDGTSAALVTEVNGTTTLRIIGADQLQLASSAD